jgi:transaldolase
MDELKIEVMVDGASLEQVSEFAPLDLIGGFTSNPSLMRAAGVKNYEAFAREAIQRANSKPFSFEVVADDFSLMLTQARKISSWGPEVYVKIPASNSMGESSIDVVKKCRSENIRVNVTAVFTREQIDEFMSELSTGPEAYLSIFAGRIADTGVDPCAEVKYAVDATTDAPNVKVIWASTREVLNLYQAASVGCHVITAPPTLINKYVESRGKNLADFSLETVQMFVRDANSAGLSI